MKNVALILIVFIVMAVIAWGIWSQHQPAPGTASGPADANSMPMSANPAVHVNPPVPPMAPSGVAQWREYQSVRAQALAKNPDLAAEYKSLLQQLDQQEKDLEAVMIKANPAVAPVVAKLERIRKRNSLAQSSPPPSH